jgi:hypothetical protein
MPTLRSSRAAAVRHPRWLDADNEADDAEMADLRGLARGGWHRIGKV